MKDMQDTSWQTASCGRREQMETMRQIWTLACLGAALAVMSACGEWAVAQRPAEGVDFDRQIKPLLSDRCFVCHGPDAENRQGDLRLDREQDAKQSVIVPGKPEESELVRRITTDDPDERMPPPDSKLSLTDAEQELIKAWIAEGAGWRRHWSFEPPQRVTPPALANDVWRRGPIDAFVLRDLRRANLRPSSRGGIPPRSLAAWRLTSPGFRPPWRRSTN